MTKRHTMFVIAVLFMAAALSFGCSDSGTNGERTPKFSVGGEGGECNADGTCNESLSCNAETKTCLKVVVVQTCEGEGVCPEGYECKDNKCTATGPKAGEEGGACLPENKCSGTLVCKENKCAVAECVDDSKCKLGMKCSNGSCVGAQKWVVVGNSADLKIYHLLVVGDLIYGGSGGGVFKFTADGGNWTETNNGLPGEKSINSLISIGNAVYVDANYNKKGIYRTTNGGISWTAMNNDFIVGELVAAGEMMYARTYQEGIYRSEDGGVSWKSVNIGPQYINAMLVVDKTVYAASYGDVYKSTNQGDIWTNVTNGSLKGFIFNFVHVGTEIYVGAGEGGVFKTADGGAHWAFISDSLLTKHPGKIFAFNGAIYVRAEGDGWFKTTDGGATWVEDASAFPSEVVHDLFVVNNTTYAATDQGVFKFVK